MDRQPEKKGSRHSIELVVGEEEDILWTPAKDFLKSECEKKPQSPQSRVSSIINGCINTLSSLVPMCVRKSPRHVDLPASRFRGKIPNDLRIESISGYCFEVPSFQMGDSVSSAEDFQSLVNSVRSVLNSHLEKAGVLLENEKNFPDKVSEIVRVAFGHTDLLLRKRMSQFSKQLQSYLMPAADAKLTTLNDLIGLWSLIDSQLVDIRKCFKEVEECRLAGWQVPKQAVPSAKSVPSSNIPAQVKPNRFVSSQPSGSRLSTEDEEKEKQRKAALEAKRKEMDEKRRAMIQAKRAELQKAN